MIRTNEEIIHVYGDVILNYIKNDCYNSSVYESCNDNIYVIGMCVLLTNPLKEITVKNFCSETQVRCLIFQNFN